VATAPAAVPRIRTLPTHRISFAITIENLRKTHYFPRKTVLFYSGTLFAYIHAERRVNDDAQGCATNQREMKGPEMTSTKAQMLVTAAAPDMALPHGRPLTLTTNFAWIVGICVAALFTVPLVIAWTASFLLK